MSLPTPDDLQQLARERATQHAEQDLPVIAQLLESKGWAYLERRLREHRDAIRATLADNDNLTGRQTRSLRAIVKEYDVILRIPYQDRIVHHATLTAAHQTGPSRG